jgi:guanine deaminase
MHASLPALCVPAHSSPNAIQGKIERIVSGEREDAVLQELQIPASSVRRLRDGEFIMPGLIDTHVHAPQ